MNKPKPDTATAFALPDHAVVAIHGRDAHAFAQAQFMSNLAGLGDEQWQWSGWLTPKGRLIALFALLRLDGQTLWLLLPDMDAGDFAARLQRFVFRSKLVIDVRSDLNVSGAFVQPTQAQGSQAAVDGDGSLEFDFSGDGGDRSLRISPAVATTDDDDTLGWKRADLTHGLPRLPPTGSEQWTPQQLSLDRLRAFSVKKGCYPGQEIVARTHFLGQAKRGLVLLEADGPIAGGAEVQDGDEVIGRMISTAGEFGLAVLPLGREFASLSINGMSVRQRPVQGGLDR